MGERILLLDAKAVAVTIRRLCEQLAENHPDFSETVFLGLQPRGVVFAERVQSEIKATMGADVPLGYIDPTFHRDDFRRRPAPLAPNRTHIPFVLENKRVVLIDDVLFTGRSVRAALDALISYGRPALVELMVLINRKYARELPIEANYIGRSIDTVKPQRVLVDWQVAGMPSDNVWLLESKQ